MRGIKALFAVAAFLFAMTGAADATPKSGVITVTGCWYGPGSGEDADAMFFIHNDDRQVDVAKVGPEIFSPIIEACSISTHFEASKTDTCCKLTFEGYLDKKKKMYKITKFIKAEELK